MVSLYVFLIWCKKYVVVFLDINENIFLLLKKKDVDFDYKSCFLF